MPVPRLLRPGSKQTHYSSKACLVKLHLPHGVNEVSLNHSHLIECDGATLLCSHHVIQGTHICGAEFCPATNKVPHVQHLHYNMTVCLEL